MLCGTALRNRGVPERDIDARVHAIAAMTDLTAMLKQKAAGLTARLTGLPRREVYRLARLSGED